MKNCAYCGRDNVDDAVFCRECGTGEFVPAVAESQSSVKLEAAIQHPRRSYPIRRHFGLAALFFTIGLVVSAGLAALIIMSNLFSGWGDGSGSGCIRPVGIIVIPQASYYFCGMLAAIVRSHILRVVAAMVAHMTAVFTLFTYEGVGFPDVLVFGTFALFSFAWYFLLREDDPVA